VAWQSSGTNIPHFVHIGRDENLGDVLDKKSKQADYSFFKNIVLPKFLQKPSGESRPGQHSGQTIGQSTIVPTTSNRRDR